MDKLTALAAMLLLVAACDFTGTVTGEYTPCEVQAHSTCDCPASGQSAGHTSCVLAEVAACEAAEETAP